MLTSIPSLFLSILVFGPGNDAATKHALPSDAPALESEAELIAPSDAAQDAKPEAEAEKKKLSGSVTAGVSTSFGNTEITKVNVNAAATYQFDKENRLSGLFDWLFSEEENQTTGATTVTQRRVRGALQYDRFFSEKMFGFLRGDAIHDGLQALQLRGIVSAGVGYQFQNTDEVKTSIEVGLAWTHEDFEGRGPNDFLGARVAGKYFRQVNENTKFTATVEWNPSLEEKDDHVVLWTSQIDYDLGEGLVTSLRWEFDWDNTPGPAAIAWTTA